METALKRVARGLHIKSVADGQKIAAFAVRSGSWKSINWVGFSKALSSSEAAVMVSQIEDHVELSIYLYYKCVSKNSQS